MPIEEEEIEETSTDPVGGILSVLAQPHTTTREAQQMSRRILERTLSGETDGSDDELLSGMRANAEKARQALTAARERILKRRHSNAEAWLAAAAAFGSPTRTGAFGETLGNVSGSLIEPLRRKNQFTTDRDKELMNVDMALSGVDDNLLATQFQLEKLRRQNEGQLSKEALKTLGKSTSLLGQIPTKAREAVDRAYSKEYLEFIQTGAADATKSLQELEDAKNNLRSGKDSLTGPIVGLVPKGVRDVVLPSSADVQETVEATVQRSLRPILGAQFTEKEGERLISRVYNPRLEEKVNAKRLELLITQLRRALENKIAAAEYFEENGTLTGFQGKFKWTIDDIWPSGDDETVPEKVGSSLDRKMRTLTKPSVPQKPAAGARPRIKIGDLLDPVNEGLTVREMIDAQTPAMAEGGVVEEETIEIELDDGSVIPVPMDATQEQLKLIIQEHQARAESPEEAPDGPEIPEETGIEELRESVGFEPDWAGGLGVAGAGALGGLGAKYGLAGGMGLTDLLTGQRPSKPEALITRLLEEDQIEPRQVTERVRQSQRRGVPSMVLDEGGPGLEALAESVMTRKGDDPYQLLQKIAARQGESRSRVSDQVNRALKPDEYFGQEKKLKKQRATNARPLYEAAYKQFPSVKSTQLMKLLETPSGKAAVKAAVKSVQDKPGSKLGRVDAMGMVTKPSLEFLDQVKIELDDMIKKEEGAGPSRIATARGKRLRSLREAFVNELDAATTKKGRSSYVDARNQYQEDSGLLDALKSGREDFLSSEPAELAPMVQRMSAAEKENLRSGVAQKLFEMINNPTSDVAAARKVIGSPGMSERLALLFDSPKEFEAFQAALEGEMAMFDRSRQLVNRGKRSRPKHVDPEQGPIQRLREKTPALGVTSPIHWVLKWAQSKPEIPDESLPELVNHLKAGDTKSLAEFEKRLQSKYGRTARRQKLKGRAAKVGALLGSGAAIKEMMDDDEDSEHRYAKGGKVTALTKALERLSALIQGEPQMNSEVDDMMDGLRRVEGVPSSQRNELEKLKHLRTFAREGNQIDRSQELNEKLLNQLAEVYFNPDVKAKAKGGLLRRY